MSVNTVDIRPGVSVLAVLRYLNYKPWFALAEFVDNAIQSYLSSRDRLDLADGGSQRLRVSIEIDSAPPGRITIRDNAAGIAGSEFPRAFRPAVVPLDASGLSEFGMGMKSAACWFSSHWRVRTKAVGEPVERTVTGLTIPGVGGISTTAVRRNEPKPNLYTRLSDLLDAVQKRNPDGGVLLTIDEIEKNALNDLGRIGSTIQHLVRENRPIKIVAAGLPQYLNELLNENHTTFLRRAYRLDIGALEWDSARRALHDPIVEGGRNIDPHDLDRATAATHGYPFLTQVIGDEAWRANEGSPQISASDVDTAIGIAGEAMGRMVHEPALRQLSNRERDYLMAVAQFDEACPTSDVADRLGIRVQAGANLRAALEDHGLVYQPERGSVDLAVPFLREHLRTHGPTPRSALVGPAVGFAPVADVNTAALGHPRGVLTPQPDARTTPHSPAPQGQDRASELDRDADTGPEL